MIIGAICAIISTSAFSPAIGFVSRIGFATASKSE
jgi:hypothetical protein